VTSLNGSRKTKLTAHHTGFRRPESTTTREAGGLNFLPAALAAGKKRQKHVCALMLNLQQHPVWARIKQHGCTGSEPPAKKRPASGTLFHRPPFLFTVSGPRSIELGVFHRGGFHPDITVLFFA
jgi:hypothetical protein